MADGFRTSVQPHTGLDYQTLRDFAYTARRVELSLRNDKLDFSHHRVVAKLEPEDQKHWLAAAQKHDLSVRRLRMSLNSGHIVSINEMNDDPADKGMPTYMTWLNRLTQWWSRRTSDDPISGWDAEDRARLKRDLQPMVDIYNALSE